MPSLKNKTPSATNCAGDVFYATGVSKKESSGTVSRVLCPPWSLAAVPWQALAIYLRRRSRAASIVLPSGSDGQPSLILTRTDACSRCFAGIRELSTSGVHSTFVAKRLVGSYPTFSPLPCGGSFLLHLQTLADFYLLGSGVPCVARTFLSSHLRKGGASGKPFRCFRTAKVDKKREKRTFY